jgi:general secretion pathway protein D
VLIGGDRSERQKVLDVISQLDVALPDDGATQVVYLNYASAENLAPILEGYAQQADAPARPAGAPGQAPAGGGLDGKTRIIADKDTNALVITGSPKSIRAVKNVIAQLDIKRAQVLVEGVIAEVSTTVAAQLGIDWAVFNPDRVAAAGILDPSTLQAALGFAAGGDLGLAAAGQALSPGITAAGGRVVDDGKSGTSFAILLKALQGDGDTNVLSTPTVVATDNEESELSVGQEVPFLTGRFTGTGVTTTATTGIVNPFQTIERKDVGLTLGITPQINEGDNIKLKLKLEVSSLAAGTSAAQDLITNKRTLNTTVTVESGQILVLGGLMDDNIQDSVTGIPFLSRLPLIGGLFQFRKINKQKRNLMIFIRPIVLRAVNESDYYTRRKYDAVRQSQIDQINRPRSSLLPRGPTPVLQRYDDYQKDKPAPPGTPPPRAEPAPAPVRPGADPIPERPRGEEGTGVNTEPRDVYVTPSGMENGETEPRR